MERRRDRQTQKRNATGIRIKCSHVDGEIDMARGGLVGDRPGIVPQDVSMRRVCGHST